MKISRREMTLMMITGTVALFAATAILARSRFDLIKSISEEQATVRLEIEKSRRLLDSREHWSKLFSELGRKLPQFSMERKMDVYWLARMDETAARHGVSISQRRVDKERRAGEVYEIPIEVKEWSASLDAIVHFMVDLQSEGVMLDLRQLYIRPKDDGSLRGSFTMFCAYTRSAAPVTVEPKGGAESGGPKEQPHNDEGN